MYARLNPSLINGNLKPRAEWLAKNGGDPKEMQDACSYLGIFPGMRHLCQILVMKTQEVVEKNGGTSFEVYRLVGENSNKFFLKDSNAWTPKHSVFALRGMTKIARRTKDRKQMRILKGYQKELQELLPSELMKTLTV